MDANITRFVTYPANHAIIDCGVYVLDQAVEPFITISIPEMDIRGQTVCGTNLKAFGTTLKFLWHVARCSAT